MRSPAIVVDPCTERVVPGVVVPIPNKPVLVKVVRVVVAVLMLLMVPQTKLPAVVEANQ